jgi:hypothetical protein
VSLAAADDPYYYIKGSPVKFIPRVVLINDNGEIIDTVDMSNP